MNHQELEQAVSLYVAGALEPTEQHEVEQHLNTGCTMCQTLLREYQDSMSMLPLGLPVLPVPPGFKEKILQKTFQETEIEETPNPYHTKTSRFIEWLFPKHGLRPVFATILTCLLLGVTVYSLNLQSQLGLIESEHAHLEVAYRDSSEEVVRLQNQIADQEKDLTDLQKHVTGNASDQAHLKERLAQQSVQLESLHAQLTTHKHETELLQRAVAQKDEVLKYLLSPKVKVVSLKGLKNFPGGAFLLFDPERNTGLFYAYELQPLPHGKTYQLWAVEEKPISMGVFNLDHGQKGRLFLKNLRTFPQVNKFEVSVEPTGGASRPTGDVHLLGET